MVSKRGVGRFVYKDGDSLRCQKQGNMVMDY